MASYTGMTLSGEVRESVSLDEDDLSDVEDEVFIRDGKNSYKLAEELNVKRPLMAPRRKSEKNNLTNRLKNKSNCKTFCKPLCYVIFGLSVIVALIALVIVLVSIYPLPLDMLRSWIISKSKPRDSAPKLLTCSSLKVTDVWSVNLPKLTSESPMRSLDVNTDGIADVLFGFGTGDNNYHILPPDVFCLIFMGVQPPCEGGVIALNGTNGNILWRTWINDTIFFLQCTADVNLDGFNDCLAIGTEGTIAVINARNGSIIWQVNQNTYDVYVGNFIPDQDDDKIPDILTSYTTGKKEGFLVFLSGKDGKVMKEVPTPNKTTTYFMPQLLKINSSGDYLVLFGTGSPISQGDLDVSPLTATLHGNLTFTTIYHDDFKGMLTQAIRVDITGDDVEDIVIGMLNSTIVAFNGLNFQQIWNFTVPNSESNIIPTPAYFNDDNVTDFLITYEKHDSIVNYNYTETYIIDGKTGRPIYQKPFNGVIHSQLGGLSLSMESFGNDLFLFWTKECKNPDKPQTSENNDFDICQQPNTSRIIKLNALGQNQQPPGVEVYNSLNRFVLEFNNTKTPINELIEYARKNQVHFQQMLNSKGQFEMGEANIYNKGLKIRKYGSSSFRHKSDNQGLIKNYMENEEMRNPPRNQQEPDYETYLNGFSDNSYQFPFNLDVNENPNILDQKDILINGDPKSTNRDPRSKANRLEGETDPPDELTQNETLSSSIKKNLADDKYGIYGYKNIRLARSRLLHDLNKSPTEILKDTYFKNRESQLKRSKFEQRDINSHRDKTRDNLDVKKIIDKEKNESQSLSTTLWDVESEKEVQDKSSANSYWRQKREVINNENFIRKITSTGVVLQVLNNTNGNAIDIVFLTYWVPTKNISSRETEVDNCVQERLSQPSENQEQMYQKNTAEERKNRYRSDCESEIENLKSEFSYFDEVQHLSLGQMTVYRLRIECMCNHEDSEEKCAKFQPPEKQSWQSYLGRNGDGLFGERMN